MRHFVEELDYLRSRLLEMSALVEDSVYRSVLALSDKDPQQAQKVLQNEAEINRMEIEIDDLATRLLALQQPMATDLRLLTSAIKINNDLERMGDLAVNIVERALSLINEPLIKPLIDIPAMATRVQSMIRKSLDSFVKRDAEMARTVLVSDDAVDELRDAIYEEVITYMERDPKTIRQGINLIFVARNLERLADHATNIAEDVLFLVEGVDVRHHAEARD
ncbi:MAG TPA: phosphate signaling complex protein PhoU [Candidatus Acidoferrales bacterium]|nr:phosphate signaling complex protein PhoU [Candidatus Acidoferrales bacterium]